MTLAIERAEIARFVRALLPNLDPFGYVSLRAFRQFPPKDGRRDRPLHIEAVRLNLGLEPVIDAAERVAARLANDGEPAVFAPPICTFSSRKGAKTSDVHEAPVLSVEIDQGDVEQIADGLSLILGERPTIALHSGSLWADPETGKLLPKGHLHWRLRTPARGPEQQKMLRRARDIATLIAGGDPTGCPPVHPLRWPGSWNHKVDPPVMAKIIEENSNATVDLADALAALEDAAQAANLPTPKSAPYLAADDLPADLAQLAEWLSFYPTAGLYHWRDWNNAGMAIHRATGGSEAGYQLFRAWSETSRFYNEPGCRTRWDAITGCPANWIGARFLRRKAIERGWTASPELDDANRPTITVVKSLLHRLADDAERAIIASGIPVYHRGVLVRPAVTEMDAADGGKTHIAALRPLGVPDMLDLFCRTARWQQWSERSKRNVPTDPPLMAARILLAREGQWKLPQLRGILSTPTLRRDGSLLMKPGYDQQSRYFLALPSNLHIPAISDEPAKSEAVAALALVEALLRDFPFIDDGGASRAVGVSLLITAVIRAAMIVAPIHAASSPAAGTGKSYLYDIGGAIVYGDRCPVVFAGKSPKELEKKLNGILLRGTGLFNVDNLNVPLEGDLLCQAAERPLLDLRRLGKSDMLITPNSALVGACGNNLIVYNDLNRRVVMANMDANVERPEQRDFKGSNPFETILKERGKYIAAVLTIVRAYLCDPMGVTVTPLASYDDYTRFVREPLVWLGRADPARTMDALAAADPVVNELHSVMSAWETAIGTNKEITAAEIVRNIENPPLPKRADHNNLSNDQWHRLCKGIKDRWRKLGDALNATGTQRSGSTTPRQLAAWLGASRGRIADRKRFTSRTVHGGGLAWRLAENPQRGC
jgi:putative DNA primase/helicase